MCICEFRLILLDLITFTPYSTKKLVDTGTNHLDMHIIISVGNSKVQLNRSFFESDNNIAIK